MALKGIIKMNTRLIIFLLFFSCSSFGSDCYDRAGRDYRIDPDLLRAISFRESSFQVNALNVVSSDKYAVGYMQIHSQNFEHLAQFGITPEQLYSDGCMNIYTGAYILAMSFKRLGVNWDAVGAYNAGFSKKEKQVKRRLKYAQEVHKIYIDIKNKNLASITTPN